MPKNIVICSDGTGNSSVKDRGTNVFKLFEAVDLQPPKPGEHVQVAFYDDGVGTESIKPLKLLGGAFGWGLSKNVRDLYLALARVYAPEDRIYLFGFSRGAYTARFLAALIVSRGVPYATGSDQELKARAAYAFKEFRKLFPRKWYMTPDASASRPAPPPKDFHRTKVEFVGVWDTVDAVGFPVDEVADFWDHVIHPFKFPELGLSRSVVAGRHALSIDDARQTFHPTMWDHPGASQPADPDHLKQVWFSGAHSNVGGGYPKQGMSLVALDWMMQEAKAHGLRFLNSVETMYHDLQNVNDKLYDPRAGLAVYYRYKPRPVQDLCAKAKAPPQIHVSVIERIALGTEAYAPGNLPPDLEVVGDVRPEVAQGLTAVLRNALASGGLEPARRWVFWKELSQRLFVLVSVVTVAYILWALPGDNPIDALGRLFSWTGIFNGLRAVASGAPWLLAALAGLTAFGYYATARMERIHSEFWFPLRPQLQQLLMGGSQTNSTAAGKP